MEHDVGEHKTIQMYSNSQTHNVADVVAQTCLRRYFVFWGLAL